MKVESKNTGLKDGYNRPIYVGDRFYQREHEGECCNHWIECEVKEDKISSCGFGLYRVDNGKYFCNAVVADQRKE